MDAMGNSWITATGIGNYFQCTRGGVHGAASRIMCELRRYLIWLRCRMFSGRNSASRFLSKPDNKRRQGFDVQLCGAEVDDAGEQLHEDVPDVPRPSARRPSARSSRALS